MLCFGRTFIYQINTENMYLFFSCSVIYDIICHYMIRHLFQRPLFSNLTFLHEFEMPPLQPYHTLEADIYCLSIALCFAIPWSISSLVCLYKIKTKANDLGYLILQFFFHTNFKINLSSSTQISLEFFLEEGFLWSCRVICRELSYLKCIDKEILFNRPHGKSFRRRWSLSRDWR